MAARAIEGLVFSGEWKFRFKMAFDIKGRLIKVLIE
jgi:hypothetical protein